MTPTQESHDTLRSYKAGCRCDSCVGAQRDYDRAYYQRRREIRLAQVKAWQQANRERVRAINAAVVARDPERARANARKSDAKSRALRPEAHRDRDRRYRESPHGRAMRALKMQRRRGVVTDEFTSEMVALLLNDPCCYCGGPGGSIDHIVPIASGGTSESHNLTAACLSCNASKRDTDLLGFLSRR